MVPLFHSALVDTDLVDPEPNMAGNFQRIAGTMLRVQKMTQKLPKVLPDCKALSFDDDLPSRERWTPHVRYSLIRKLVFEIANNDLSGQGAILL